ncbi:MAG: hypothetical protein M0R03_18510 [Novosphingobium sp.]|nr:hypothetical protein [Novosphingobium sp.]
MKIRSILTDAERQRVSNGVTAAETESAGEILTILTTQSDSYADVALAWSALVALLALSALTIAPGFYFGIYEALSGGWLHAWTPRAVFALALTVTALKFGAMWLLQLWMPLRLALVPGPVKAMRVRRRAVTCFRVGAERRTHGRTGVLIYLSRREHRAEIVADEAIAAKVPPEVWGDVMAEMIALIREDRVADGLCAAVERVGAILADHFPRADDDRNELPDRLIEV